MHAPTRALTSVLALAALLTAAPPVTAAPAQSCTDPQAPLTVEEQRLNRPVPLDILKRSELDGLERRFRQELCSVADLGEARRFVAAEGRKLWELAVDRAQGGTSIGGLPVEDDRPLYWARLSLTRALRQWTPSFPLDAPQRDELLLGLERASRGQTSIDLPGKKGVKRVLISGFDPFQLDFDIRQANPSGAAALALDGKTVQTETGPARIEAAMFPVLWEPFERGMVERTFLPHLREVDTFATVSQGRPEQFDIEHWNGRWHTGLDNNNETRESVIPIPDGVPTVQPPPEFVPTTQPIGDIVRADTGRFPVFHNPQVTEIPAGEKEPVVRPDGPTPGSVARAGGGGSYLSNEIAYRTTLLRDAVGVQIRGGHVHTPILAFKPGNDTEITDPVFEANLRDIVSQVGAIVAVAAGTPGNTPAFDLPRPPRDRDGNLPAPSN